MRSPVRCYHRKFSGFTLVELVTVIIVLGVVSVGISGFIRTGVGIYSDVTEREQLLGDSRFVVERLNRELSAAIPNSIRVSSSSSIHCIEFVNAEWASFYTSLSVSPDTTNTATLIEFFDNVAGFTLQSGDMAIVYPTTESDVYDANNGKRSTIQSCTNDVSDCTEDATSNTVTLTLDAAFADYSPASRLYIARQATSYCLHGEAQAIYRYQGSISTVQENEPDPADGVLMAENLVNDLSESAESPFTVNQPTLNRNGLVQLLLAFEREDEVINFNSEVHIPNVP